MSKQEFYGKGSLEENLVNYHGEEAIGNVDSKVFPIPTNPEAISSLAARAQFLEKQKQYDLEQISKNPNNKIPSQNLLNLLAKMEALEASESKSKSSPLIRKLQKKLFLTRQHKINSLNEQNPNLKYKGLNDGKNDFFGNEYL
jgi:hypothetical protein